MTTKAQRLQRELDHARECAYIGSVLSAVENAKKTIRQLQLFSLFSDPEKRRAACLSAISLLALEDATVTPCTGDMSFQFIPCGHSFCFAHSSLVKVAEADKFTCPFCLASATALERRPLVQALDVTFNSMLGVPPGIKFDLPEFFVTVMAVAAPIYYRGIYVATIAILDTLFSHGCCMNVCSPAFQGHMQVEQGGRFQFVVGAIAMISFWVHAMGGATLPNAVFDRLSVMSQREPPVENTGHLFRGLHRMIGARACSIAEFECIQDYIYSITLEK